MLHHRTHPVPIEGCDACRWASVNVSAMAMPTRNQAQAVIRNQRVENDWDRDHEAYRRLRKDGLQPMRRDGARDLEQRAECAEHVETGMTHVKPRSFEVFREEFGHSALTPVTEPTCPE